MPRIVGIDLPKEKRTDIALTYIYGIGRELVKKLLAESQVDGNKRAKDLSDEEISRIAKSIHANYKVEGDLRRDLSGHIKRMIDINAYRGIRHKKGLPVRGQQTRTNARTRKGPRPRVGGRKRTGQSKAK